MELQRFNDARRHLMTLMQQDQLPAAAIAELEDLLGQCARERTEYDGTDGAEAWFRKAIEHHPHRVDCYDRLARLLRVDLHRIEAGDGVIKEMVASNPQSGRAYLHRWQYSRDFLAAFDPADLEKALKLAPDDPDILFTSAAERQQKKDLAAARAYYEKGFKLFPKNIAFAIGLARLETQENHLNRAEAVLRQSLHASSSIEIAFRLADILVIEGKIEGKDQANDYITLLRNAGLGDTFVRFLEAEIPFHQKKWAEAIRRIETARAALGADPQLTARLNLMLAECYGRMGDDERRLDALREAAQGDRGLESAHFELAHALARSGKLDQAVTVLLPLADHNPEWRLDLVRLLIQRMIRLPRNRRNWQEVERTLYEAEKSFPQGGESVLLLRLDILAAQGRLEDARKLVTAALAKEPAKLRYRLARPAHAAARRKRRRLATARPDRKGSGTESGHQTGSARLLECGRGQ